MADIQRIAIQGDLGSNHDLITRKLFPASSYELSFCKDFPSLFAQVEVGEASCGVLAIENSIAGSILGNFDLLSKYEDLEIVGEGYLRIEHCLIGLPEAELGDIKVAYSHEMALKQCEVYLSGQDIEPREYYDTAASVAHAKGLGDKTVAGIAPAIAAEVHGMKILKRGIETDKDNYTRFIVIQERATTRSVGMATESLEHKTMLELQVKHEIGALVNLLQKLADSGFNLTKIESRPIIGQSWHYQFYIDFVSQMADAEVRGELANIEQYTDHLRILGSFPVGKIYQP